MWYDFNLQICIWYHYKEKRELLPILLLVSTENKYLQKYFVYNASIQFTVVGEKSTVYETSVIDWKEKLHSWFSLGSQNRFACDHSLCNILM